jgi:hypothetical protein
VTGLFVTQNGKGSVIVVLRCGVIVAGLPYFPVERHQAFREKGSKGRKSGRSDRAN